MSDAATELQDLGAQFGCPPGVRITAWLRIKLAEAQRAEAEIGAVRADNRLLAFVALAATPDKNTQTEAEVAQTEAEIEAAIDRALPGLRVQG